MLRLISLVGVTGLCAGHAGTAGGRQRNHVTTPDYVLSARVLSKAEISREFVSEVYRSYVVLKVTLRPTSGSLDVRHLDFHLAAPGETDRYPADAPAAVAAFLEESAPVYRDITVTPAQVAEALPSFIPSCWGKAGLPTMELPNETGSLPSVVALVPATPEHPSSDFSRPRQWLNHGPTAKHRPLAKPSGLRTVPGFARPTRPPKRREASSPTPSPPVPRDIRVIARRRQPAF